MISRILLVAIVAGAVAGVFAQGAQMLGVTPLIHQAESYENSGDGHAHGEDAHAHAQSATSTAADSHTHGSAWVPADGIERHSFTLLTNVLTGVAFGFLLTAAIAFSGRDVTLGEGIAWGAAGFAVFSLAPAIGLPPELPGSQAADVGDRQLWWAATAAATAAGLAAAVFANHKALKALGLAIIALPHIIGAPHPEALSASPLPAELAAEFVVASLVTALAFWVMLGGLTGYLYERWAQRG
jgi:cobalt transporter subunit CbtA